MTTPPLTFWKVTSLPGVLVPDGMYLIKSGGRMKLVVADAAGAAVPLASPALQVAFGIKGMPPGGRELGRYRVTETIDWDAALSAATSGAAAAAQADLLVTRGVDLVARYRWNAATSEANVSIIMPTSSPGDVLVFTAPAVQDTTLASIAGALVGNRRT